MKAFRGFFTDCLQLGARGHTERPVRTPNQSATPYVDLESHLETLCGCDPKVGGVCWEADALIGWEEGGKCLSQ